MNLEWISNDTIALVFLGIIAVCGVFTGIDTVTATAIGAIGGYIGSKVSAE